MSLPQKYESHSDRVSTGSGSDLVQLSESKNPSRILMPVTDQVATAPGTDPIHNDFRLLRQSYIVKVVSCNGSRISHLHGYGNLLLCVPR